MAINTIYATIQMRRDQKVKFDPDKMSPGEWAVSIDSNQKDQWIWMCFAPGVAKRLGTYEDFHDQIEEATTDIRNNYITIFNEINEETEGYMNAAQNAAGAAAASATAAAGSATAAASSATQSDDFSKLSESHNHGNTGVRPGEDTDNSKYWSEQSKAEYERAKNEANRAENAANFIAPKFLIRNNRLYVSKSSTVDFKLVNNRLYFKIV